MASQIGVVGVCFVGVSVVFVDNVTTGKDPFGPLLAGSLFTAGCVGAAQVDVRFGEALAWIFLLGNLLLKTDPILNFVLNLAGQGSANTSHGLSNNATGSYTSKPMATNTPIGA